MNNIDEALIKAGESIADKAQTYAEAKNFYCRNVVKETWPEGVGFTMKTALAITSPEDWGKIAIREYSLKHSAINGPDINTDDIRPPWELKDIINANTRIFELNMEHVWGEAFRESIYREIYHREVATPAFIPESIDLVKERLPRKVNFLGKRVLPYVNKGTKYIVNRKYKKAATQYIQFDPDIVHFQFPDRQRWAGEIIWRTMPDIDMHGAIGFYRSIMTYAAKPIDATRGKVVTQVPPGIRGWLWYWAWRIARYVP